jgi:hypothetical protein
VLEDTFQSQGIFGGTLHLLLTAYYCPSFGQSAEMTCHITSYQTTFVPRISGPVALYATAQVWNAAA